ncbi:MAG: hypothetical protein H5T97_04455, partial [Firmicutes bacterium]|nr:hypothetical protein [Bacillota bacterium]
RYLAELEPSLRLADGRTVARAAEMLRARQEVHWYGRLALPARPGGPAGVPRPRGPRKTQSGDPAR